MKKLTVCSPNNVGVKCDIFNNLVNRLDNLVKFEKIRNGSIKVSTPGHLTDDEIVELENMYIDAGWSTAIATNIPDGFDGSHVIIRLTVKK
jgi:hypothetical protein